VQIPYIYELSYEQNKALISHISRIVCGNFKFVSWKVKDGVFFYKVHVAVHDEIQTVSGKVSIKQLNEEK
jgi:hypothetical protein